MQRFDNDLSERIPLNVKLPTPNHGGPAKTLRMVIALDDYIVITVHLCMYGVRLTKGISDGVATHATRLREVLITNQSRAFKDLEERRFSET